MHLLDTSRLLSLACLAAPLLAATDPKPSTPPTTSAPTLGWGRQWGTAGEDFGRAIASDSLNRCFVAGSSAGDLAAKNFGKSDALVVAYDRAGMRLWATQFGSADDDIAMSVALAPDGTLFVGGTTGGKLSAGAAGGRDVFIARLDSAGQILWLRQFGSAANDDAAAVVADRDGNVYVTGATEGKIGEKSFGGTDAFLLKVDPQGTLVWARQWGSDQADFGRGLAIDAHGALYVTGGTAGAIGRNVNAGQLDMFVSKITPVGEVAWTRQFGTNQHELGMSLRVGTDGSLYVGGSSAGAFAGPQLGEGDAILMKLTATGELVWKRQFGTANWDGVHGVALSTDASENILAGGCQNPPQCQAFLRAYTRDGTELWATMAPADQPICGTQIADCTDGRIFQTGGTNGPAYGEYRGEGNDLILVRYDPPTRASTADPAGPAAQAHQPR